MLFHLNGISLKSGNKDMIVDVVLEYFSFRSLLTVTLNPIHRFRVGYKNRTSSGERKLDSLCISVQKSEANTRNAILTKSL